MIIAALKTTQFEWFCYGLATAFAIEGMIALLRAKR